MNALDLRAMLQTRPFIPFRIYAEACDRVLPLLISATNRVRRSSLVWGRARSNSVASIIPSETSRSHRAAKPFNRPARAVPAIKDAYNVPQGWSGRMRRTVGSQEINVFENAAKMRGGWAGADLADRVRIAGAQARISPNPTTGPRGLHSGLGALGDKCSLELCDGCRSLLRASVCPFGVHWLRYLLADVLCRAVSYAALMRVICSGRPPLSGW